MKSGDLSGARLGPVPNSTHPGLRPPLRRRGLFEILAQRNPLLGGVREAGGGFGR